MDNILIIKAKSLMSPEQLDFLRSNILNQKASGVIVLPSFCEAIVTPENVAIRVEGVLNDE